MLDVRQEVHGMVIKHNPVGDYDQLVTLLTAEKGKINAFARGVRRMGARLSSSIEPLSLGSFFLYAGKNSYTINEVKISEYFEGLKKDLKKVTYASFFLELADYYNHENIEASDYLNLLYISLKAIDAGEERFSYELVRCAFEIRSIVIDGTFPGALNVGARLDGTKAAISHISCVDIRKILSFKVEDEVLKDLKRVTKTLRNRFVERKLNSIEMLGMYEEI